MEAGGPTGPGQSSSVCLRYCAPFRPPRLECRLRLLIARERQAGRAPAEERRARHADRLMAIRLRLAIGRELEERCRPRRRGCGATLPTAALFDAGWPPRLLPPLTRGNTRLPGVRLGRWR